ncbi:MAG: hypothetical protein CMP62_01235, partial [Flavobacteriales bacterium]|nr:hypothetical protein [Flavobacteriales bacterium]
TDQIACNFNEIATDSCVECCIYLDGICETCEDGQVLDNDIDDDQVCNDDEIIGCQDQAACNYDNTATDPGQCIYELEFYDCNNICINDVDGDGVCDELEVVGCTDNAACNYNPYATDPCNQIDGFSYISSFEGKDYYLSNTTASWTDANNLCSESGGNLIVIESEAENTFITDLLVDISQLFYPSAIWLGLTDQNTEGNWEWVNGAEFLYENWNNELASEPNNSEGNEDYVNLWINTGADNQPPGTWNDWDNTASIGPENPNEGLLFILEIDPLNQDCCIYLDGICESCEDGQIVDNDIDDDLVCDDDEIPGCTDPAACNYDESLGCTDDDGSCFYSEITVDFSTQPASCEAICDGEIELTINNGQPPFFVEYILNGEDGFETTITGGGLINACTGSYLVVVSDAFNCESEAMMIVVGATEFDTDGDGVCDNDELQGCTDENACNFNPLATEEDNSCEYCYSDLGDIDGNGFDDCELINNQAFENGNNAVYDCNGCINDSDFDGVCDELEVVGCTDNNLDSTNGIACNYNELATDPCPDTNNDGVLDCCEYPIYYYLDCDENCLNDSDGDGVCDEIEVNGCNDILACNYDEEATESGNCVYAIEFYDCNNICINDIDGDGVCDELEVEGCQNGEACNFNPLATDPCADCCAFVDADQDGFPEFITSVQSIQDIDCAANSATGYSPGAFLIYTTGGLGPYTLTMDNVEEYSDDGIFEIEGLSGGSYNIFVSDANGCETLETIDIQQPDQFEITIEYLNYVSCENYFNGALTGSVQGGTPPYELEWLAADGTVLSTEQDVNNLVAGIYAFKVTDANGCTYQEVTNVGNPNPLELDFLTIGETTCYGGSDGYVEILVTGGTSPYTDIYTDINGSNVNPNLLSAGDYTVTITDNNNCVWIDEFTITEPDPVEVSIQANETEICEEEMVTIVSVPDNFSSYIWSEEGSGNIFADNDSSTINIAETGNYMLTVIDANGCEATSNIIEIIVYENPEIVINGTTEVLGNNTYTYYVTGQGQQYEWSIEDPDMGTINGNNNESSISITWDLEGVAEIYLTQTSEFGCSTTESIEVTIEWPTYLEEELEELEFTVYPNPFTDYTNIEVNNPNSLNYNLYLYDIKGVMVKAFINETRKAIKLEENLSSGIYHLQLISSTGNRRKLIVVE